MLTFGQQIKIARIRKNFSPADVAAATQLSTSTITKIEGDKDGPGLQSKLALARFLGVPFHIEKEVEKRVQQVLNKPTPLELIPQWECAIAAGSWTQCDDVFAFDAESVEYKAILRQGLFRVRISGDSMQPDWSDGSLVEFRRMRMGDDGFVRGEDYYVHRTDGMATFKRFVESTDDRYVFRAVNRKKYKHDLTVSRQEVALAALAVGIFLPRKKA